MLGMMPYPCRQPGRYSSSNERNVAGVVGAAASSRARRIARVPEAVLFMVRERERS